MDLLRVSRVPAVLAIPEMSVSEAVALMVEKQVGAVVITNPGEKVLGIFTERDNLIRVTFKRRDPDQTLLSEVMTAPVDTVSRETTVEEALTHMISKHFRHLPIVDTDHKSLGIVSIRYLLMRRLGEKQASLEALEAYVGAGGPG